MLLIFPIALICSMRGKVTGGNTIYTLCRGWTDVQLALCGIRHINYFETPHEAQRPFVFVFNHNSYMDIPILLKAIRRQHIRILGKAEMATIPIFGFFYRQTVVLVDRHNADKRARSVMQLKSILRKGISVVIAPEGTFNMTEKPLKEFYDGAFRIAIETQTALKPLLFLDNCDRLNYKSIFSLTPGKARVIYLEAISVEGLTLKDVQLLKEKVFNLMEKKLIEYKASWIKPQQAILVNDEV